MVTPPPTSELTLASRFLPQPRAKDLVLMDRDFISYGFFWDIQNRRAYFGTRLKKNLPLVSGGGQSRLQVAKQASRGLTRPDGYSDCRNRDVCQPPVNAAPCRSATPLSAANAQRRATLA